MTKKIIFMGLSALAITLAGCSWTDRQIGPNDYEISGYFDFTMKGEVVVKGLEDQARLYCKAVGQNLVPQVYYITDKTGSLITKLSGQVRSFVSTASRTMEVSPIARRM